MLSAEGPRSRAGCPWKPTVRQQDAGGSVSYPPGLGVAPQAAGRVHIARRVCPGNHRGSLGISYPTECPMDREGTQRAQGSRDVGRLCRDGKASARRLAIVRRRFRPLKHPGAEFRAQTLDPLIEAFELLRSNLDVEMISVLGDENQTDGILPLIFQIRPLKRGADDITCTWEKEARELRPRDPPVFQLEVSFVCSALLAGDLGAVASASARSQ